MENKEILITANKAVANGDNERFLAFCTEETRWRFVGDISLDGKDAVRQWMRVNYIEPPVFQVENLIAEKNFVTAVGNITMANKDGEMIHYKYCDVWRFERGKIAELKAFVIESH